jgi:hypothetical protein
MERKRSTSWPRHTSLYELGAGLLHGGETVESPSAAFLADLEEDWRNHGKEIFPILRAKYPQAYFQGIVSLARIIRWDVDPTGAFRPKKL